MKILKLIADWRYGNKPSNTRDYEDLDPNEREYASFWYLHGKLEELVGYDKATVTNLKEGGFGKDSKEYGYMMCLDGIVPVEIEGIHDPCVGYFWITKYTDIWVQRGLVCLKSDFEGCEYAERKYKEKPNFL
jgi:hypothetical protein